MELTHDTVTKLGPRPSSGSAFVKNRISASLTSNG